MDRKRVKRFFPIILCFALALVLRILLLLNPAFNHLTYDEAVPGLMAIDMLKGIFTPFYWGAPYLGTLESMTGALFFKIFSVSAFWIRMSPFLFSLVFIYCFLSLAKQLNENKIPFISIIYIAFPPLAFHEYSLSPMGGYMHTLAIGALLLTITARFSAKKAPISCNTILFLALLSGIGFWNFIMIAPFIAAIFLEILLKNRKNIVKSTTLFTIGFFSGSSVFWYTNLKNNFCTFTAKAKPLETSLFINMKNFLSTCTEILGNCSELAKPPLDLTPAMILIPVVIILYLVKQRPYLLKNPVFRLLTTTLILFFIAFVAGEHGAKVLSRYGLPLYATLAVLFTVSLENITGKKSVLYVLSILYILVLNTPYNISFLKDNYTRKRIFSVEEVVSFLKEKQINGIIGHYTITQPIAFAAKNDITAADFNGFRNIAYLKKYDQGNNNAVVTSRYLPWPPPSLLRSRFRTLFAEWKEKKINDYTIFYDLQAFPDGIPLKNDSIINIKSDSFSGIKSIITDRTFGTNIQSKKISLEIKSAEKHTFNRIMLSTGENLSILPDTITLTGRINNEAITIIESAPVVDTFTVFNNSLKYIPDGFIDLRFKAVTTDNLRIDLEGKHSFHLDELVLYEDKNIPVNITTENDAGTLFIIPEKTIPFSNLPHTSVKLYHKEQAYDDSYKQLPFSKRSFSPSSYKFMQIAGKTLKEEFLNFLNTYQLNYSFENREQGILIENKTAKNDSRKNLVQNHLPFKDGIIINFNSPRTISGILIRDLIYKKPLPKKLTLSYQDKELENLKDLHLIPRVYQRGDVFFRIESKDNTYILQQQIKCRSLKVFISPALLNNRKLFLLSDEIIPPFSPPQSKAAITTNEKAIIKHIKLNKDSYFPYLDIFIKGLDKSPSSSLFVHFKDKRNNIIYQKDFLLPKLNEYAQRLIIDIPQDLLTKTAKITAGLFNLEKNKRLKLKPAEKEREITLFKR